MKLRDGGIPINPGPAGTDEPGATVRYENGDLRRPVVVAPEGEAKVDGLSSAESAALEKWAGCVAERTSIEEFFDWAGARGLTYRTTMPLADILDRFYGIDRKNLEAGRQALLVQVQRKQKGGSDATE